MRDPELPRTADSDGVPVQSRECIFSVDVEDWFHILDLESAPALEDWAGFPSRVENDFFRLLDLLEEAGVRATCFFLGWVAHRYPHLVREADRRGHEPASHGYAHRLAYRMGPHEFLEDAIRAKRIIEDACGRAVCGYRAAGFSVTEQTPWFFEKLAEAGYSYDSSVFPARRNHGGLSGAPPEPSLIQTASGAVAEFPISVVPIFGVRLCFFGGGYLRLFPLRLIKAMAGRVLAEGRPVVFYVHPREIDPAQPRLKMPAARRFRCYVNLRAATDKLRTLLRCFRFTTFSAWLEHAGWIEEGIRCGSR